MNAYLSEEYSIGNGRIDEIVAKEYSSENATKEYITGEEPKESLKQEQIIEKTTTEGKEYLGEEATIENLEHGHIEEITDEINVTMYGVKGDGISDDTKAINVILKENAGKEIYFPAGTYIIDDKLIVYSDTIIKGDGENTVFLSKNGKKAGTEVFQIKDSENILIEKICVSGNSAVNNGELYNDKDGIHLLDMWNVTNIIVNECSFINNIYCGIRIFGGKDITIQNSNFLDVDCGIVALGIYNISNLMIESCYFNGHNRSEAISLYGQGVYENINIHNNVIANKSDGHGILINDNSINQNIVIDGNLISGCAVGISIFQLTNGSVFNNKVDGTTSGRGIEVYNCKDTSVNNNEILNTNFDSLSIKGCVNCDFMGNHIFITANAANKDMAGIKVLEGCKQVTISNNIIQQVEESLNKYSIYIKENGEVDISGNQLNDLPIYSSDKKKLN